MHQYMHANSADQICWSILLEVEVEWISQPPPAVGKNYPMQMQAVVRRRLLDRRLSRDNLDENGGKQNFEAAAGSGVMIVADLKLCKGFFGAAV